MVLQETTKTCGGFKLTLSGNMFSVEKFYVDFSGKSFWKLVLLTTVAKVNLWPVLIDCSILQEKYLSQKRKLLWITFINIRYQRKNKSKLTECTISTKSRIPFLDLLLVGLFGQNVVSFKVFYTCSKKNNFFEWKNLLCLFLKKLISFKLKKIIILV